MGRLCTSSSLLLINIVGHAFLDDQSTIFQVSNRRDTHSGHYVTIVHRIRCSPSFIPAHHSVDSIRLQTQSVFPTFSDCVLT